MSLSDYVASHQLHPTVESSQHVTELFKFGIEEDREVLADRLKHFEANDMIRIKEEAASRERDRILEAQLTAPGRCVLTFSISSTGPQLTSRTVNGTLSMAPCCMMHTCDAHS